MIKKYELNAVGALSKVAYGMFMCKMLLPGLS